MNRLLGKNFLSGVMFIAFGVIALWFGRNLALGTSVRMGPGYVPHMLADIMMLLGSIICLSPLVNTAPPREKQAVWIPLGVAGVVFILAVRFLLPLTMHESPWLKQLSSDWLLLISVTGVLGVILSSGLISSLGNLHAAEEGAFETVEPPKLRPIILVTIGIIVFALLFETTGMFPALVALILISSLGGDEFKLWEVIVNIVVLTILCVLVFKVLLGMNISVIEGVW
ncbi:MAG TPA: tripartite tricarboxylate transporter TctB family protein [Reyranella sp.]|nr:tripartite tricarboxylate transporter TctB family protein [Reyranella sp.]